MKGRHAVRLSYWQKRELKGGQHESKLIGKKARLTEGKVDGGQAGRLADWQADMLTSWQIHGGQAGGQAGNQVGRRLGMQDGWHALEPQLPTCLNVVATAIVLETTSTGQNNLRLRVLMCINCELKHQRPLRGDWADVVMVGLVGCLWLS